MVTLNNKKQRETLLKIFGKPTPNDMLWRDIESLLRHLGYGLEYRDGSALRITMAGYRPKIVHRPHPGNQAYPSVVGTIRRYLEETGNTP